MWLLEHCQERGTSWITFFLHQLTCILMSFRFKKVTQLETSSHESFAMWDLFFTIQQNSSVTKACRMNSRFASYHLQFHSVTVILRFLVHYKGSGHCSFCPNMESILRRHWPGTICGTRAIGAHPFCDLDPASCLREFNTTIKTPTNKQTKVSLWLPTSTWHTLTTIWYII
jgi:hypothetical protein